MYESSSTPYCVVESKNLGQFGVYNVTVDRGGCEIQTSIEPVNTNLCKIIGCYRTCQV